MLKFNLHVNLSIVLKYVPTPNGLKSIIARSIQPVEILSDICKTSSESFIADFKNILVKHSANSTHDLTRHADNLLAVLLLSYRHEFDILTEREYNIDKEHLARQLAKFLLQLSDRNLKAIRFSFDDVKEDIEITDDLIMPWLKDCIIHSVESQEYPFGNFGMQFYNMVANKRKPFEFNKLDRGKLKKMAQKPVLATDKSINKAIGRALYSVKHYLDEQTSLKVNDYLSISNEQANLFYDFLKDLFKLDSISTVFPDPTDYNKTKYARSFLRNSLIKLEINEDN
jgi:hypothetical protein